MAFVSRVPAQCLCHDFSQMECSMGHKLCLPQLASLSVLAQQINPKASNSPLSLCVYMCAHV